jgi:hypothetical protein
MIHDVLIPNGFKWFKNTNNKYPGLRKAHKITPQNMGKEDSMVFGMLLFLLNVTNVNFMA